MYAHSAGRADTWTTHGYEAILAGERDEALEQWGLAAAAYGHRLLFRWDHEMNGSFLWSGRDPDQYTAVFRHVSDRVRNMAGASNVEFFFCPSLRQTRAELDLIESYYPGDEWCQCVGLRRLLPDRALGAAGPSSGARSSTDSKQMTDRPIVVGEFGRRIDLPAAGSLARLAARGRGCFRRDLLRHEPHALRGAGASLAHEPGDAGDLPTATTM